MSTTYVTQDGFRFQANRSRTVVEILRAESWLGRGGSKEDWMHEVAMRAHESTGRRVRADTTVNFVRDLIGVGLLKKES